MALSIATDVQWESLKRVLGEPLWAADPTLNTLAGRTAAHDHIDAELKRWAADRDLTTIVEQLVNAGVPAAPVVDPRTTSEHPQMRARGFFETCTHPVVGTHPIPTLPFRFAGVDHWLRNPAPTLGQHNHEVLGTLLGLSAEQIAALEAEEVIGTRPKGL